MHDPRVSVLMSAYNEERFVRESVETILGQTLRDFEFIIINDGSTDGTRAILESYSDPRIRLVHQPNLGLTKALNAGLRMARGEYIARQDAGDASLPQRLDRQVAYLDRHPDIAVLGAWMESIDEEGDCLGVWTAPTDTWLIRWRLLFNNCLPHTAVMYRKRTVSALGGYDESSPLAEDYDLWMRLSRTSAMANISDVLVRYRQRDTGLSARASGRVLGTLLRFGRDHPWIH